MSAPNVNKMGCPFYSGVPFLFWGALFILVKYLSSDLTGLVISELKKLGGNKETMFLPCGTTTKVAEMLKLTKATMSKIWTKHCQQDTVKSSPITHGPQSTGICI